jgi:hypothetical protein
VSVFADSLLYGSSHSTCVMSEHVRRSESETDGAVVSGHLSPHSPSPPYCAASSLCPPSGAAAAGVAT